MACVGDPSCVENAMGRTEDSFLKNLELAIKKQRLWCIALVGIPYLLFTSIVSAFRPLWFDELFTFYIARLPRLQDMWSALPTLRQKQTPR